jgi:hypothetical protein
MFDLLLKFYSLVFIVLSITEFCCASAPTMPTTRTPTRIPIRTPSRTPSRTPTATPTRIPSSRSPTRPAQKYLPPPLLPGLVAYYSFDGDTSDSSGNALHATSTNTMFIQDRFGIPNQALYFNGEDAFVQTTRQNLPFRTNNSTLSFWMKVNSTVNSYSVLFDYSYVLAVTQLDSEHHCFAFIRHNDSFLTPSICTTEFIENFWNHVALVYSRNRATLYVNGQSIDTVNVPMILAKTTLPLRIGTRNTESANSTNDLTIYFQGAMDDVSLYNRSLTAAEVSYLYSPRRNEGLIAYYPFNGNANDMSGNENHGVIRGNLRLIADHFGTPDSAYTFDGSTGYIEILNGYQFEIPENMTVAFWLSRSAAVDGCYLFQKSSFVNGTPADGWNIQITSNGSYSFFDLLTTPDYILNQVSGSSNQASGYSQVPATTIVSWNHFAYVKKGRYLSFYQNGVLLKALTSVTSTITFSDNDLPFIIGAANFGGTNPASGLGAFFTASMDEIYIFDRALTPSEVSSLYGSDTPTVSPTKRPSVSPTRAPSGPTRIPTRVPTRSPTRLPTRHPTVPTAQPNKKPTSKPTSQPSRNPSVQPSIQPTGLPSSQPSSMPTAVPSAVPSGCPTVQPSSQPSRQPTVQPTSQPTRQPTSQPSKRPTSQPTSQPSMQPTSQPSRRPTSQPTS